MIWKPGVLIISRTAGHLTDCNIGPMSDPCGTPVSGGGDIIGIRLHIRLCARVWLLIPALPPQRSRSFILYETPVGSSCQSDNPLTVTYDVSAWCLWALWTHNFIRHFFKVQCNGTWEQGQVKMFIQLDRCSVCSEPLGGDDDEIYNTANS